MGVDAELRGSDWLQVTQENTWRTNGGSPWLVHHSEVIWSGGGLKESLISVHTITLQQHHRLDKRPALVQLVIKIYICSDAFFTRLYFTKCSGLSLHFKFEYLKITMVVNTCTPTYTAHKNKDHNKRPQNFRESTQHFEKDKLIYILYVFMYSIAG